MQLLINGDTLRYYLMVICGNQGADNGNPYWLAGKPETASVCGDTAMNTPSYSK
jgi:hypothetical protein